jgi:hypothetical protein
MKNFLHILLFAAFPFLLLPVAILFVLFPLAMPPLLVLAPGLFLIVVGIVTGFTAKKSEIKTYRP